MPKCPKCDSSAFSSSIVEETLIRKCLSCDHVYSKHPTGCKCNFCYCAMCFLHFMDNSYPELDSCLSCKATWEKNMTYYSLVQSDAKRQRTS